ncbi:hypothetical protein AKJ39_03480 [candidate division MSBL1 archaeon SCGC-AAA259J03]|uniref:Uncharacterized protein n=1 Tax=candidate division MSBL1 archaeon SCGC-AAA259J03 TaxID=1698269 RepID=A0A656YVJ9_9EURY|nr:hypothetical protein AKJ39_03480 [candidate division MSBL1 archaeon SCGC-AAA259J03]
MNVYCMNCGEKLLEKRDSCPECGSGDLFDMNEFRTFAEKKMAEDGVKERLTTLAKAETGKVANREASGMVDEEIERLFGKLEEKLSGGGRKEREKVKAQETEKEGEERKKEERGRERKREDEKTRQLNLEKFEER